MPPYTDTMFQPSFKSYERACLRADLTPLPQISVPQFFLEQLAIILFMVTNSMKFATLEPYHPPRLPTVQYRDPTMYMVSSLMYFSF